jgi:hypothetical protein
VIEGSYLLEKIRHRCIEEGDCLLWQGAVLSEGLPRLYSNGQSTSLRRLLWVEKHGEISSDVRIGAKCRVGLCVAPAHLIIRDRCDELKGTRRSQAFKAKIAAAKRSKSRFTPDFIEMVRTSPLNNCALGREIGLNHAIVAKIRNHQVWKDYSTPFAGLGARGAST